MIYNRRRYAIFLATTAAVYIQNNKLFMETVDEISVGRLHYPRRNLIIIIWVTLVSLPNSSRLVRLAPSPTLSHLIYNNYEWHLIHTTNPHRSMFWYNRKSPKPSDRGIKTWVLTDTIKCLSFVTHSFTPRYFVNKTEFLLVFVCVYTHECLYINRVCYFLGKYKKSGLCGLQIIFYSDN